jgi:hypothetical protein
MDTHISQAVPERIQLPHLIIQGKSEHVEGPITGIFPFKERKAILGHNGGKDPREAPDMLYILIIDNKGVIIKQKIAF